MIRINRDSESFEGNDKYVKYKKVGFATFFVVFTALSIVFIILYVRCYWTYNDMHHLKGIKIFICFIY